MTTDNWVGATIFFFFKTSERFVYLAALGLSWGTQKLFFFLWYVGSLDAPWHVGSSFLDQGSNPCPLHWKIDS